MTITNIKPITINVSEKTDWTFIAVETDDGVVGVGESTLFGREAEMTKTTKMIANNYIGQCISTIQGPVIEISETDDRVQRAVVSALEQASWDIRGKREGKPIHALLGGAVNELIPIYANINRRTLDRSPAGFAASSQDAVAAGYKMIKIAPFDGLQPEIGAEGDQLFSAGIDRILATCDAVGPTNEVLVDCHWRLSVSQAKDLLRKAAEIGLYWVECPLPENLDDLSDLMELRSLKDSLGVRLAGTEKGTCYSYFERFVAANIYDVIMPDVKYTGGVGEMIKLAELAQENGIGYSPHNPSGPVCHMASLHVTSAVPNLMVLEHQFDESPLFMDICPNAVPAIKNGMSGLPVEPGMGIELN